MVARFWSVLFVGGSRRTQSRHIGWRLASFFFAACLCANLKGQFAIARIFNPSIKRSTQIMSGSKYTVYGGSEIDTLIESHMNKLVSAVLKGGSGTLSAIVLGGGYGRGEGGVKKIGGKDFLFNDYDLFLISKNLSRKEKAKQNAAFKKVAHNLSSEFGIEVDFSPLKNESELSSLDYEMVWLEAKLGHVVLWGNQNVFDRIPNWDLKDMPLEEAARLLMNRGMGILLSKGRLGHGDEDAESMEFVERNAWKAIMAAGDTHLILNRAYDSSYRKRLENFKELPSGKDCLAPDFGAFYAKSIGYKLLPPENPPSKQDASSLLAKATEFLLASQIAVASRMAGRKMELKDLADCPPNICASKGFKGIAKNIVLNAMKFGPFQTPSSFLKHPRGRIFAAIPFFSGAVEFDPLKLSRLLGLRGTETDRTVLFNALVKLWERFS